MDLTQFTDEDLDALERGDVSSLSDEALDALENQRVIWGPEDRRRAATSRAQLSADQPSAPSQPAPEPVPNWRVAASVPAEMAFNVLSGAEMMSSPSRLIGEQTISSADMRQAAQRTGLPGAPIDPARLTSGQQAGLKGATFAAEAALFPGGKLSRLGNALIAGTGGIVGHEFGQQYGPEAELATNLATGGIAGLGLKGAGAIGNRGLDVAATLTPNTAFGENRLLRGAINRAASESPPESLPAIKRALESGEGYVPGVSPTTAEVLSQSAVSDAGAPRLGGGLIALERNLIGTDPYQTSVRQSTKALADEIADLAGGRTADERRTARAGVRTEQQETVRPMFEGARTAADKGRRVIDRLNQWKKNKRSEIAGRQAGVARGQQQAEEAAGQIPALERTRNNALQQEGQLRTGAAVALNQTNPRPPLAPMEAQIAAREGPFGTVAPVEGQYPPSTEVPNPFQPNRAGFYPVEGQPRVPGRYSPQVDRAAEMSEAADEFGAISAQARQDIQEVEGQIDSLMEGVNQRQIGVDQAKKELDELAFVSVPSLQGQPLVSRLRSMADADGTSPTARSLLKRVANDLERSIDSGTGTVSAQKLQTVRSNLTEQIERFSGAPGSERPVSRANAIQASGDVKKMIDDAVKAAGAGPEWTAALETYGRYANELDKRKVLDLLARSATPDPRTGKIGAEQFIKWTGGDSADLLKKAKIDPDLKNLEELLGPEDFARVMNIRKQILRNQVATNTQTFMSEALNDVPQAFNVLDPKVAALNWALRGATKGNKYQLANKLSDLMAKDPRLVGQMIKLADQGVSFSNWARTVPGLLEYSDNKLAQSLEQ